MGAEVQKGRLIAALCLLLSAAYSLSSQEQSGQRDSLLRLMSASYIEQLEVKDDFVRRTIDATFLHNGTYLMCDSAVWSQNANVINCKGHVRMIQGDTELTSEELDYLIDQDLAQFRGPVVQLQDKQENMLRTRELDYNTKDSVAVFRRGASMRSSDGQIIESDEGRYFNALSLFKFVGNVNMYTDSVFVRTDSLDYQSDRNRALFISPIDFRKDDNLLSAGGGWYSRPDNLFFFTDNVRGLTRQQESWSDTLYFYRGDNDILMRGRVQVQDTTRSSAAVSDYLFYRDSLSRVIMRDNAAVAMWTKSQERTDTTYFGADTLIYHTERRCDIPGTEIAAAEARAAAINGDPVSEFRRRAAEQAAQAKGAAAENKNNGGRPPMAPASGKKEMPAGKASPPDGPGKDLSAKGSLPDKAPLPDKSSLPDTSLVAGAARDSLAPGVSPRDTLAALTPAGGDSLAAVVPVAGDSLAVGVPVAVDSLAAGALAASDSLASLTPAASDSLSVVTDSLAMSPPPDTSRVGFLQGIGNVKIFRQDIQVRCDSMRFSELDSIARFYKEPLVWNEGRRQYSADSLFVLVKSNGVDRASLMSNAFIAVQEDSVLFDQIKGSEVMAYFDSDTQLRRFDALGGVTAVFYLQENDVLATVNKVEAKMLSATLKGGELERVYYFESPKNDAAPIVQMPEKERELKGFLWKPELRPSGKSDITALELRPSEREELESRPRARFPYTDRFFPGHMEEVYRQIEEARRRRAASAKESSDSTAMQRDSAAVADSLSGAALLSQDSLAVRGDSLGIAAKDSLAVPDSLGIAAKADSLAVQKDSSGSAVASDEEQYMSKAELRRALRRARRDARWAELDARDAARAAAREQKKAERRRRREERRAARIAKQEAKDNALLQKYIEYYTKKKEREDRKRQAAASSVSAAEAEGRKASTGIATATEEASLSA